jgi:REP element-mobilizing transposase RayT
MPPAACIISSFEGSKAKRYFKDVTDREDFIERLSRLLKETVSPCYALALMTNHVHLLLLTGTVPVPSVMRRLLTGYGVHSNPAFSGTTTGTDIFFRIATKRFSVRRIGISSRWSHTLWDMACKWRAHYSEQ